VYFLCVNVYCITATGCQTQLQLTNISIYLLHSFCFAPIRVILLIEVTPAQTQWRLSACIVASVVPLHADGQQLANLLLFEQITYWVYYAYVWVGLHLYSMPLAVSSYRPEALGK
jgi:hypothetical protein